MRAREYLFRFPLLICYKPGKANFVLDALSCLLIVDDLKLRVEDAIVALLTNIREGELDTLFTYNTFIDKIACSKVYNKFNKHYAFAATLIKITPDFKEKFI
jgi:ABC-type molybdate transport system substrate-binding protein